MTSRRIQLAVALAVFCLLLLPGCRKEGGGKELGPITISLAYNGGNCTQSVGNAAPPTAIIDVYSSQSVTYEGPTANSSFEVDFAQCPFAACPVTSAGGPKSAGAPTGGANGPYYYSGMKIDGQNCQGVGQDGVRIKPGP